MEDNCTKLFIIGYMGSGKTSVAQYLSQVIESDHLDMDNVIAEEQNMSIDGLIMKYGEHTLRNYEGELLDKITDVNNITRAVISCSSGIILDSRNRNILERETVIYLDCDPGIMYDRIKDKPNLPNAYFRISDEIEQRRIFSRQYDKRKALYEQVADLTINTENNSAEKTALEIAEVLHFK